MFTTALVTAAGAPGQIFAAQRELLITHLAKQIVETAHCEDWFLP